MMCWRWEKCCEVLAEIEPDDRPSEVAAGITAVSPAGFIRGSNSGGCNHFQAELLDNYYGVWRRVKTCLSGDDLRAMGLKPGPSYGVWLDTLLAARLDGEIKDEAGELALLRQLAAEDFPVQR